MMRRNPRALQGREFDVAVVGGGITGACVAHDAALRGLSVALVERRDFGAATSAASSKLLHGGIRYLQHAQFGKVRESAQERARFQRIAPHLTRYVPFVIPTYRSLLKGRALLGAGMTAYELLTAGADAAIRDEAKRSPRGRWCPRDELARLVPDLAAHPDVTGARILFESHMYNSERMTLAFVRTAARHGAIVCNYVRAVDFMRDAGHVTGLCAIDELSGASLHLRARLVVNAAGPWIARMNGWLEGASLPRGIVAYSKGAHVVTRPLTTDVAVVLSTSRRIQSLINRGGRHLFVIPWRRHSLIGTTNTPFTGELDEVSAAGEDVDDLLADVNAAFPSARLTRHDVTYAYAGLYPLADASAGPGVYHVSGEYQIIDHEQFGRLDGLLSVLGARYTTAPRVAERAVDVALRKLGRPATPSRTASVPLAGGEIEALEPFRQAMTQRFAGRVTPDVLEHLIASYGSEAPDVIELQKDGRPLLDRLAPDRESIEAEVVYAAEREQAVRLEDVIFRRTGLGTLGHPGRACLTRCARLMAEVLNWSDAEMERQVAETLEMFRRVPGAGHHD